MKKLGRERSDGQTIIGQAYDNIVEIDPRQTSQEYMDTLIHEFLHIYLPHATEKQVIKMATWLCEALWKAGYRRTVD